MPPSSKVELPNLGRIGDARLDLVPLLSDCTPGLIPTEYNVIVAPAKAAETVGSKGLLIAPDETKDSMAMAMQVGRIVAASPIAFNYDKWPAGNGPPRVGQIVWFARYAGGLFTGLDGREYRIIKDKDIGAVIADDGARTAQQEAVRRDLEKRSQYAMADSSRLVG